MIVSHCRHVIIHSLLVYVCVLFTLPYVTHTAENASVDMVSNPNGKS